MSAASVMTVTGPVATDALGHALVREHLVGCFATPDDTPEGWESIGRREPVAAAERYFYERPLAIDMLGEAALGAPNRDDETLDDEGLAAAELALFAEHGGHTIVDATTAGEGRDPVALRRLSERTGVAIVMSAGWRDPAWSPQIRGRSAADLSADIVRQVREGIAGVCAGVIGPLAPLDPADADARNLLLASARAAVDTGVSLTVDAGDPTALDLAFDLVLGEGAPPSSIAVGRCGDLALDVEALENLAARGVFVAFDRLGGIPNITTRVADHDVAVAAIELARRGYGGQILLSQSIARKHEMKAFGGNGYCFIAQQFARYLGGFGADETLVHALTVANPARFLAVEGGAA